jgi:hypothetical protein
LLEKLKEKKPELYESYGASDAEMATHMSRIACLSVLKHQSKITREISVSLRDKKHLTEEIRKLYNQGDTFHPYY